MVAMEMMVVVAMPVHYQTNATMTTVTRGREPAVTSRNAAVTGRWRGPKGGGVGTTDRHQGVQRAPTRSYSERPRTAGDVVSGSSSAKPGVKYTGSATPGGTWYSIKPLENSNSINSTTTSDSGISTSTVSTSSFPVPSNCKNNNIQVLPKTISPGSGKSPPLSKRLKHSSVEEGKAVMPAMQFEQRSRHTTTPVLLPSQVRWPQRETGEYVSGKNDGNLSYKSGRNHTRSRSYDCTYRTPIGTPKMITVPDVIMNRYDADQRLGHLQEDDEEELGILERDENGAWHNQVPQNRNSSPTRPMRRHRRSANRGSRRRSPSISPSRNSNKQSPSPPRSQYRDRNNTSTPTIQEQYGYQNEELSHDSKVQRQDIVWEAQGRRSRQSSREPSLEDLTKKQENKHKHKPQARKDSSNVPQRRSRQHLSEGNESVNSETVNPRQRQQSEPTIFSPNIVDPPPQRKPRCRQNSENHYGTHSEPPRYQRRSRETNSKVLPTPTSTELEPDRKRLDSLTEPVLEKTVQTLQKPVRQSRRRQDSTKSSSESLVQNQSFDSNSKHSNSKIPIDLIPSLGPETTKLTQRQRSHSRPPNPEDFPSKKSEPETPQYIVRPRSQSVQPRQEDRARISRSDPQRQKLNSQLAPAVEQSDSNNKHEGSRQRQNMALTSNGRSQDRNFDGSRHTHASRLNFAPSNQSYPGHNFNLIYNQKDTERIASNNEKSQNLKANGSPKTRPQRPGYTPMQSRIMKFETVIQKTVDVNEQNNNTTHKSAEVSILQSDSCNTQLSENVQNKSMSHSVNESHTPRSQRKSKLDQQDDELDHRANLQVELDKEQRHPTEAATRTAPPVSPFSTPKLFSRGVGIITKSHNSRNPPILRDANRRSLTSRKSGSRKRVQIVEETEPGHDSGGPKETSSGENRKNSRPKVLLGHIASLSHSFSFGSGRKLQARLAEKQSLVVSDGVDFTKKLNGAPSATSIQHASPGVANTSVDQIGPSPHGQRSARWAIGFDRLLDDCAGLETFTEFLKKELSQENIEFWLKCENYKQLSNEVERQKEARYIWKDHLAPFASDSVNVDSATLAGIEDGLDMAPNALFDAPQTHILQLMKQDSYPRFLKSDLYKQCVVAEMEGKPVPYLGTSHNPRRREEKKPISKSKSSVSVDKGGKRRGSFFTFSWKSKSEKRLIKSTIDGSEPPRWSHKNEDGTDDGGKEENSKEFCRVILPDGSTTVFHAKPGTPIKLTIQHLCQRRNLSLAALEVFQQGVDKPLDLTKDVATLASKLIWVELRVLFQVDLPSRRSLVVRAKPELTLRDALKPILPSYNLKVDNMVVHMVGSDAALDLDGSVTKLEGQRLTVQTEEDFAEWGFNLNNHRGKPPVPSRSKSTVSLDSTCDDEHLVRDVADGKLDVAHLFDENGVYDPDKKHDKCRNEEGRTSGLFGFIRRNSAGEKDSSRLKSKHGQPATVSGVEMDRPRPRVRPPIKDKEAENLFEQLNKLSGRLDDQRGDQRGLRGDLELPDFLKVDKPPGSTLPTTGKGDTPSTRGSFRTRERRSSDSSILDVETSRRLSQSQDDMNFNGFGRMSTVSPSLSNRIPFIDHSFSQDGVVPTHAQADEAFVTARHYPGSPDLNMVWVSSTSMADGPSATRPPVRLRYSPRSRTPDARRTLLQESNGYAHRNGEVDEDLSVQPLLDGSAQSDNGSLHMDIAAYSPKPGNRKPIPSARKVPPQPPPRKTLTTPKKFLPSPTGGGQQSAMAQSPRHSQQNSTSSDLSHHSDSTIATTHSGSSGGNIRASASSTPSPTTHDLCLGADSSQESTADAMSPARRTCPQPPPRPSRRSHVGSSGGSSADEGGRHQVQKTLNFEQKESITKQNDNDMPVSYV